jgi:hypothetical protein
MKLKNIAVNIGAIRIFSPLCMQLDTQYVDIALFILDNRPKDSKPTINPKFPNITGSKGLAR